MKFIRLKNYTITCNLCSQRALIQEWANYNDSEELEGYTYVILCSDPDCPNPDCPNPADYLAPADYLG